MFEADIHFRLLHTSMVIIYNMFEPLVCCLKGMLWVHPNTVTMAKLSPDLGILGRLWSIKMVPLRHSWGWYPPQTATHIHIRHIQSVWAIGMLSQGHMGAPLYRYTGGVVPIFGKPGSLEEWEWCHNVMIEADIHLRPLHTFILDICKVFEPLLCCLKGICMHTYTYTQTKLAPDLGIQGHWWSENEWHNIMVEADIHFRWLHPLDIYTKYLSHWYAVSRAYGSTLIP